MKPFKKDALITVPGILLLLSLALSCLAGWNTKSSELNSPDEAISLFEQGREFLEMGRTGEAILYFDKAVQKNEHYAIAWLYKAMAVETDAEKKICLGKAVLYRNNAAEEERYLIDIELASANNNPEKRFKLAKQMAVLYPENARALLILAKEYQDQGEIIKFRDLAYEAIRVDPTSPLGYRSLAASMLLNEPVNVSLAEKYMKKFVELRPNEASAHIALGDVYRVYLNLESAKNHYSKAVEIEPQNVAALSKRGYIHTYLGMFEEARNDFKRASALVSQLSDYSASTGSIFSGTGDVPDTNPKSNHNRQHDNKRLPLNSNSDNCYFCRTFISMSYGMIVSPDNITDACHSIRYELEMESEIPSNTAIEANIAFVEGFRAIQQEDYEKAKHIIERYAYTISSEMRPQKNEAHNFLAGVIHYKQGNYSKSINCLKNSDPDNVFVRYNLGLAYDKLGRFEEAKREFTEVADFNFANASDTRMKKLADEWLKSFEVAGLAQK